MTGKYLELTYYLSRHPTEESISEEIHGEEYVINILSKFFKLNHKYGQLLNTDQKFRPISKDDFKDEPRINQWNCLTEKILPGR